jgi:hypothetical protein
MGAEYTSLYQAIAGVLIAIVTGFFGVKMSKRGARAGEDAERIDHGVDAVAGFIALAKQQQESIDSLTRRTKDLEASQEVTDSIATALRERVQKISADLDSMHIWKRAALRYIIDLRSHGLKHSPEEALPVPPVELMGDLRESA